MINQSDYFFKGGGNFKASEPGERGKKCSVQLNGFQGPGMNDQKSMHYWVHIIFSQYNGLFG